MFRKAKLALLIGLVCILPSQVLAIGLGEIQLDSRLNEPLNAEIQLLQVRGLSENEILVGLAPKADFEAAGVERLFFLTTLRFKLELDNKKGPLIRVTTDSPVREPYLNFLLEVQWPNGRLLREYTLLMDLPAFTGAQASGRSIKGTQATVEKPEASKPALDVKALDAELAAVDASANTAAPQAPKTAEVKAAAQAPATVEKTPASLAEEKVTPQATAPAQEKPAAVEEKYTPEKTQPEATPATTGAEMPVEESAAASTSASTATIPVYAAPTASEGDYSVKAGDNLWHIAMKYHTDDAISIQQAMLSIQRLNPDAFINGNINLLKKGKVLRMPTREDLTALTSREAIAEVQKQNIAWSGDPNGRKAVAKMEQLDATHQEATAQSSAPDMEEGHLKLSVPGSSAESTAGKGSGTDKGGLESLQNELVISMEELDRIKLDKSKASDKIAALDDQEKTLNKMLDVRNAELAALQSSMAQQQPPAAMAETTTTPAPAEQTTQQTAAVERQPVMEQSKPAQPVETATPPAEKTKAAPSGGIMKTIMDNMVWIGGGIVTLLVLVVVAVVLRKRSSRSTSPGAEMDEEPELFVEPEAETPAAEAQAEFDMDSLEEHLEMPEEHVEEEAPAAKPETGDALSEADIYISFGTYDKAESLLKGAIAAEPKRADLRLKLLEVYAGMENLSEFDKQFDQLAALKDTGAIERAHEMRNRIPGAAETPLAGAAAASTAPTAEEHLDFDLDLADEEKTASSGGDLDFDLNLDLDEAPAAQEESHEEVNLDADIGDLDIDMDFGEEAPVSEAPTGKSPKVNISTAPTVQQKAVSLSDAPTVQQKAISLSDAPTGVSPAVKASEEQTEAREGLDLDFSALDAELEDLGNTKQRPAVAVASVAQDRPTPSNTALDEEFDFLADADEAATKLDLARAYIDMGDKEGAKDILQEVMEEGQPAQKQEAKKLLDSIA